jgi:hypothetical protein
MKLNKAEVKFSDKFIVGKLVYYLQLDIMGFEAPEKKLAEEAGEHAFVVINGDEPFKQKEAVRDFVNAAIKKNEYIHISIHTDGNTKPLGLNKFSTFTNVEYIVYGKLKNSHIPHNERVNEANWKWFAVAGAKFIFNIYDIEELEEILMLMAVASIKPHQVYLNIQKGNFKDICFDAKVKGFNIYFEADQSMFE